MPSKYAKIRNIGIALGLGATALSAVSSPATAITSPEFRYSTAKTGYYSISHMDLSPDGDSSAVNYYIEFSHGYIQSNGGCFTTGVNLPHGATLVDVVAYYKSNSNSDVSVQLNRLNLTTGVNQYIFYFILPDDSSVRKSTTISIPAAYKTVVGFHAYAFAVCIANGTTFSGARIRYTYTSAGD